jgi:hypothetical protein
VNRSRDRPLTDLVVIGEAAGPIESLYAEMMVAYATAEASMLHCQSTGDPQDVERHQEDLRQALALSAAHHDEADRVVLASRSRNEVRGR